MPRAARGWKIRFSAAAERDLDEITEWTARRFGVRQARAYSAAIRSAVRALRSGPATPGARERPDLGKDLYSLHTGRGGRRARHVIVFRLDRSMSVVGVLRILHDAMDLAHHLPSGDDQEGGGR